jgi:hypothetical protein
MAEKRKKRLSKQYTRIRPHWRPTHETNPTGFDQWIGPDGANGWVKILNPDGHHIRRVWEVAPEAMVVLRNHPISEQKTELLADPVALAWEHVAFWEDFLHAHGLWDQRHQLVFEGINEAAIWEPGVLDALVKYSVELLRTSIDLDFCVLQMNTGWPTNHGVTDAPPDWSPFEPVRQALLKYGGYLGLHEYWDARGPNSDDWGWNPGRFTQLPESWKSIPILITECGYDEAVNAPPGTRNHGYLGKMEPQFYAIQLYDYDDKVRKSGWDIRACFVFTHDWDEPWGTFDTRPITDKLIAWSDVVRNSPPLPDPSPPAEVETTPPPPVEPPLPGRGDGLRHIQVLVDGKVEFAKWM